MQLCPKNVHIGPLTGECKRPGALPLPPVVLQLPQEPPGAAGPPSPARGSAGMPPQPSPITHSARPNWDGKTMKTISDIKWEGSQTGQDLKPVKYKTDIVKCLNDGEVKDLSISRNYGNAESSGKSSKVVVASSATWNHAGSQRKNEKKPIERCLTTQGGLLAISSQEFLPMLSKKQQENLPIIAECIEERKKIKCGMFMTPPPTTTTTTTTTIGVESFKIIENGVCGKKNFLQETMDLSPNRIKINGTKIDEILVDNIEETCGGKKKKRKAESVNKSENVENKVRKVHENGESGLEKDENSCDSRRHVVARGEHQKNQNKNFTCPKGKLLKDRNETVSENVIVKGPCKKEKKKPAEENCKLEAYKVVKRRKSHQERTATGYEDVQGKRKSKSCSPNRRTKSSERHHLTDKETKSEDSRKKLQDVVVKNSKGKGIFEHSKTGTTTTTTVAAAAATGGKKKVGSNPTKNGQRQLSILNKSVQQSKNKKTSKSDYRLAVVVVKKFTSKKSTVTTSPRTGITPKWSNGWSWDSESFNAKVYLTVNMRCDGFSSREERRGGRQGIYWEGRTAACGGGREEGKETNSRFLLI